MKKIFFLLLFSGQALFAQQKINTYYPPLYKQLKETYHILNGDSTLIEGRYIKYFEEGGVAQTGDFVQGKAEGVFEEFYPNGQLLSKITFYISKWVH